jgi:two-component system, chemotaxis family, sensor kinase CheA
MSSIYESSEMIGVFLDEVEEQLQLLEGSILDLEQNGETPEVIQNIFRVAHTLKGSSSAMGFEKMITLTHEMENVLDKIRNNHLKASNQVVNILFQCADHLRLLKEDFVSDKKDIKTDITSTLNALKQVLSGEIKEIRPIEDHIQTFTDSDHTESQDFILDSDKMTLLEKAAENGLHNLVCTVRILEESPMKNIRACLILNYFNETSTVVDTLPNVLELSDEAEIKEVSYLIISELDISEVQSKALVEIMDIETIKVQPFILEKESKLNDTPKLEGMEIIPVMEEIRKSSQTEKKVTQTVRVDVERLEKMMNLVGELVIEQTRIAQVGNTLHNRYSTDNAVDELLGISNHVSRVISELQEGVMKARMLPIQQLFNRFPRMVRDLAQSLDKEVELVLEGGETEMDRTIIEDINDPLIHIIRNAIDHGLETKEERIKRGKSAKGTVKITAFHQENHVILTIEDDGGGIDVNKIKASAVKKMVISQQEADELSVHDAINLIFHTGFSTAKAVSDVSGRGVGMDIVRNHIDKLNGIIDVETKVGAGTKFIIKLPLTLAILTGLLVKINDDTYALPMSNVLEIVRKPEEEIDSIKGQSVAVIRDKVHPLVWLHDYFNISRSKRGKNVFIVVLGVAEKRFGLVVDELIGNQEIVVKPLGSYIGKVEGFSGATILGDGSVACILDVVGVAKMVSNRKTLELRETTK